MLRLVAFGAARVAQSINPRETRASCRFRLLKVNRYAPLTVKPVPAKARASCVRFGGAPFCRLRSTPEQGHQYSSSEYDIPTPDAAVARYACSSPALRRSHVMGASVLPGHLGRCSVVVAGWVVRISKFLVKAF